MVISGKTIVCGVIGDPIEHSLSPVMHNAAFEALMLDFAYLAFKVTPAELGKAIAGVRALGLHGLNVTMPHKNTVIKYLDEIEETARFLNAVNTIYCKNGKLFGYNTDGVGALKALRNNGADPKDKNVLLLGAGGAASSIAYALAQEADKLTILNRTNKPAIELADTLTKSLGKKIVAGLMSADIIRESLDHANILVNATSVGMKPADNQTPVPKELLKDSLTVMDIIYNPVETKLAKDAKAAGARVVSGVEMLVYQGAESFGIWTGRKAPIEVMRKAALNQLLKV